METSTYHFVKPLRGKLVLIAVLSAVGAQFEAFALVLVVPVAQALSEGKDRFEGELGPFDLSIGLRNAALLSTMAIVAAAIVNILTSYLRARFITDFERTERDRLFEDFMGADWQVQAAERKGRIHTLSTYTQRCALLLGAVMGGIKGGLSLLLFVVVSFVLDWRAALLILAVGGGLFLLLRPLSRRVRAANRIASQMHMSYGEELNEFSTLAREVRVYGAWPFVRDKLAGISAEIERVKVRAQFIGGVMAPMYQYVGMLLVVVSVLFASSVDDVELSALGAIALLLVRSLSYGQQLQSSYQQVLDSTPFLERLEESRVRYRTTKVPDGGVFLEGIDSLAFRSVDYRYDDDTEALTDVTFELRRGEVVGMVGPSGAGKSTVAQLLLRLRQPTGGHLEVNGEPADQYSLSSWHRHVTIVPQEPRLFHATVAENIAFLDPTLTREDIVEAARGAGVHDVIMELHDGYDTLVGPSFRDLSGGQIQRIGIARALARKAEVLVLDEPTSALDVHSEALIHDTLARLHGEALVVIIAHRLSTLSICDRLVVMNRGRVESVGSLPHVLETNDFFRRAMDLGTLDVPAPNAG
jgi:ATP-binding cassette, subfamily B, bacterial